MIIDSNAILSDSVSLTTGDSTAVGLTYLKSPGRHKAIPMIGKMIGDPTGITALEIKIQESDQEKTGFTDVPNAVIKFAQGDIKAGMKCLWRFLPNDVSKPWIRLHYAVTGSSSNAKFFAAIAREDELMYEAGMYIDKGTVVG